MQSLYLENEDYYYLENKKKVTLEGFIRLFAKVKEGYIKRGAQTRMVADHIKKSPYPVILCGDLNDTPVSYSYRKILKTRAFKDAFKLKGRGIGATYAGPVPFQRIDYIFVENDYELLEYYTIAKKHSDHFPIVCRVLIP